jgi:hypothetical protein
LAIAYKPQISHNRIENTVSHEAIHYSFQRRVIVETHNTLGSGSPEITQASEVVEAIRSTLIRINDFLGDYNPVNFVDILAAFGENDDLMQKYAREHLEDVAGRLYRIGERPVLADLSEKFTKLAADFNRRYFQWWLLEGLKVEVVYDVVWPSDEHRRKDGVISLSVSSEPTMVARIIDAMIVRKVGVGCWDCFLRESNRIYLEGAPMNVSAEMRHLSAEEFIAKETREPITEEEHSAKMAPQGCGEARARREGRETEEPLFEGSATNSWLGTRLRGSY